MFFVKCDFCKISIYRFNARKRIVTNGFNGDSLYFCREHEPKWQEKIVNSIDNHTSYLGMFECDEQGILIKEAK